MEESEVLKFQTMLERITDESIAQVQAIEDMAFLITFGLATKCEKCNGEAFIKVKKYCEPYSGYEYEGWRTFTEECPNCNGLGGILNEILP
jgi:DnaJ-class molecular chaperone